MRRLVKDFLLPMAVAVALAFVIQAAVAKPYEIPTESMFPTIKANDRIIANRLIYLVRDIERGDVIVFKPPRAATDFCGDAGGGDVPFVKRVVGLPGDRVEVRRVTVRAADGPVFARVRVPDRRSASSLNAPVQRIRLQVGDLHSVTFVNGRPFEVPEAVTPVQLQGDPASYGIEGGIADGGAYEFGPVTVPADRLVVFGDNRPGSCDSHQWRIGGTPAPFVPIDDVIGQAEVIYWPLPHVTFLD